MLLRLDRPQLAERVLHEVLAADPNDVKARSLLALALHDQGAYDRAIVEARAAIATAPDDAYAHYIHSYVLTTAGQPANALSAIGEALRLDPNRSGYHLKLARLELAAEHDDAALRAVENALQIEPERIDSALVRASALRALRRYDEAFEALAEALGREPANAELLAERGALLVATGRRAEGHQAFREAIALDPENAVARQGLIDALRERRPWYRTLRGAIGSATAAVLAWGIVTLLVGARQPLPAALAAALLIAFVAVVFSTTQWVVTTSLVERSFGPGAVPRPERAAAGAAVALFALGAAGLVVWLVGRWPPAFLTCIGTGMMAPMLRLGARLPAGKPRSRAEFFAAFIFPGVVTFAWGLASDAPNGELAVAAFEVAFGLTSMAVLRRLCRRFERRDEMPPA